MISTDTDSIRKETEKLFRDKMLESIKKQIAVLFGEKNSYDIKSKNGPAFELIEERITNEILNEKTQKIMNAYFEENWSKILHEAMDKAMRKAAEHKANQLAFSQFGLKNPRENQLGQNN